MGHQDSRIFQFYLSERVKFDVQATFLGIPSKSALIVALGSMSRSFDRRAPTKLSLDQRIALKSDPTVLELRKLRDRLSDNIKSDPSFKTIRAAEGTEIHNQYTRAQNRLSAARRHRDVSALREAREEFFRTIDTKDLDMQFSRLPEKLQSAQIDPAASVEARSEERPQKPDLLARASAHHMFQERSRIAELLFEDPSSLSRIEKLGRRTEAIANMAAICDLREVRRRGRPRNAQKPKSVLQQEVRGSLKLPRRCLSTQCLFCLGDSTLSDETRTFSFSCAPAAKRHMRKWSPKRSSLVLILYVKSSQSY